MNFNSWTPPRAETPFALKGRYPGLRIGRAAFPWGFRLANGRIARSGIVARP